MIVAKQLLDNETPSLSFMVVDDKTKERYLYDVELSRIKV